MSLSGLEKSFYCDLYNFVKKNGLLSRFVLTTGKYYVHYALYHCNGPLMLIIEKAAIHWWKRYGLNIRFRFQSSFAF